MTRLFYSRKQLVRMLHLTPRQLGRWERRGLFPRRDRYGWQDLLRANLLRQYDRASIRPATVARSLEAIRQRLPALADPVTAAGMGVFRGRVELRYAGTYMDALSGQFRLPFELGAVMAQQALKSEPDSAHTHAEAEQWFAFGLSLEGEAELRAQAAAAYERCLELDRGFTSAHINLGTLRYQEKNFAEAERCYRAALALDPDYALAHFNLGNVLDETGRLEEAIGSYLSAVRLVPSYADAHYNLALAYQRQGQPRRAVPHWQQYLGLDRQSAWADHARLQLKQTLAKDALKLVGG
ncbi:MAG TPA: tetratricopeptide repeat protein [Terriglobales bacterium]|nr:tetratricopeptide repeat protein [Terriglobales bacterium]